MKYLIGRKNYLVEVLILPLPIILLQDSNNIEYISKLQVET